MKRTWVIVLAAGTLLASADLGRASNKAAPATAPGAWNHLSDGTQPSPPSAKRRVKSASTRKSPNTVKSLLPSFLAPVFGKK